MTRDAFRLLLAGGLVVGVVIAEMMRQYREQRDAERWQSFRSMWERARAESTASMTVNDRTYTDAH